MSQTNIQVPNQQLLCGTCSKTFLYCLPSLFNCFSTFSAAFLWLSKNKARHNAGMHRCKSLNLFERKQVKYSRPPWFENHKKCSSKINSILLGLVTSRSCLATTPISGQKSDTNRTQGFYRPPFSTIFKLKITTQTKYFQLKQV